MKMSVRSFGINCKCYNYFGMTKTANNVIGI